MRECDKYLHRINATMMKKNVVLFIAATTASMLLNQEGQCFIIPPPQLKHHFHYPGSSQLFETKKDIEWKNKLREEEEVDITSSSGSGRTMTTTTTTTTLREPSRRTKADSLGRSRPKMDDGTNDNNEIAKRLQRVKAKQRQNQKQQQQQTITDPQALADYYLQHENIPRVILQADLLGKSSITQINNILPTKNFLSDAYGHVMRILPKQPQSQLVSSTIEWKRLVKHANEIMLKSNNNNNVPHLRDMLQDATRCNSMYIQYDGIYFDYTRQRVLSETMDLLFDLASKQNLVSQIHAMFSGTKINYTENRAVLHTALRSPKSLLGTVIVDDVDVIGEVHDVLGQIQQFTTAFRSGVVTGYTGKRMRNIISVGIGGSYLGPEFLHEVLKTETEGIHSSLGYDLRFLANVDPVDVERTCADLDPEETMIIVVSKTFTTAETMLNARTMRQWLWDFMGDDPNVVRKHVVACSSVSATAQVKEFGIDVDTGFFRFWDWVGGRYSVCGAAGAVPISLMYGYELFEKFLAGARSMDEHFLNAPMRQNIPIIMGLLGCWNTSFMGYSSRALIPYAQALLRLPAHIQQLDMESNGKRINRHGVEIDYHVGEVDFGEPGTNSQHSFFQLIHQGQTVPVDFIGFVRSQHDLLMDNEELSSHDELMANFFAQPDALANGKTADEVRAAEDGGCPEDLVPHKVFDGNRPSSSLLFPELSAYVTGQILSLYEHRTAVQGFIWDINSFDQWGVELGKKLALDVKEHLMEARNDELGNHEIVTDNPATSRIMNYYVKNSRDGVGTGITSATGTNLTRNTHTDHFPPQGNALGRHSGRLS